MPRWRFRWRWRISRTCWCWTSRPPVSTPWCGANFLESMVDRAAQGQTVFLSSHQIVEVERVADIVAILRKGKLLLVERLDELKAQVQRLTITLKDGAKATPALGGYVLSQRWQPRQGQAIVPGMTEGQLAMLRANEEIAAVEVHPTSLEDIFVAYMQGSGDRCQPAMAPKRQAGGDAAMSLSIFCRVFWKEYRLQRSLWIAMAALTVLTASGCRIVASPQSHNASALYLIAVAMPGLYALGCGAMLFAGEREADT